MIERSKFWLFSKNRPEKGQSLVEFALVLLFIIIPLVFGLIEASIMLYKYVTLTNAAREGARAGSIYLYVGDPGGSFAAPDAGRSASVVANINTTLGPTIAPVSDCDNSSQFTTCQITYGASSSPITDPLRATDPMTVTLIHTHSILFGALGSNVSLQSQASMRIEPSSVISGTGP